jgi:hypothetical protein
MSRQRNYVYVNHRARVHDGFASDVDIKVSVRSGGTGDNADPKIEVQLQFHEQHSARVAGRASELDDVKEVDQPVILFEAAGREAEALGDVFAAIADTIKAALADADGLREKARSDARVAEMFRLGLAPASTNGATQ